MKIQRKYKEINEIDNIQRRRAQSRHRAVRKAEGQTPEGWYGGGTIDPSIHRSIGGGGWGVEGRGWGVALHSSFLLQEAILSL